MHHIFHVEYLLNPKRKPMLVFRHGQSIAVILSLSQLQPLVRRKILSMNTILSLKFADNKDLFLGQRVLRVASHFIACWVQWKKMMLELKDSHLVRQWHSPPIYSVFISLSYRPNCSGHLCTYLIVPRFCPCGTLMSKSHAGIQASVFKIYTTKYALMITRKWYLSGYLKAAATTWMGCKVKRHLELHFVNTFPAFYGSLKKKKLTQVLVIILRGAKRKSRKCFRVETQDFLMTVNMLS